MDPVFLGIMIPFFAFAVLMLVVGTHSTKVKHRQTLEEMRLRAELRGPDAERLERQNSRIEVLEDRVQVLERIITDRGYDVATQIEALRDARQDSAADLQLDRRPERQR
jgi:hypothetical protein